MKNMSTSTFLGGATTSGQAIAVVNVSTLSPAAAVAVEEDPSVLARIHQRVLGDENAAWATVSLVVILVMLFAAVAHTRMWRRHRHQRPSNIHDDFECLSFQSAQDVYDSKHSFMRRFSSTRKKPKAGPNRAPSVRSAVPSSRSAKDGDLMSFCPPSTSTATDDDLHPLLQFDMADSDLFR